MANLELDKTLQVDGQTYNINAAQSDKVSNKLVIKQIDIDGVATPVEFDGSEEKEVSVVPSAGGKFSGPVAAASLTCDTKHEDGEPTEFAPTDVLNYSDITNVVVKALANSSILYSWDPEKASYKFTPTVKDGQVSGIGLVTGAEAYIVSNDQTNFAFANNTNKWLPAYLYVCSDTARVYYGTSDEQTAVQLTTSTTPCDIIVDLKSNDSQTFNGTQTELKLGITGVLPVEHGGTGVAKAEDIVKDLDLELNTLTITPVTSGNANKYKHKTNDNKLFGIDMKNSDLVEVNAIYFADKSDTYCEGINFVNTLDPTLDADGYTLTTYDRLYAVDGKLYFDPNKKIKDPFVSNTRYTVYHSGGETIPPAKGGTGKTDLSQVTVGQSDRIKVSYKASTSATAANKYANITIAPSASYPNGPTGGSDGDIMILF